MGPDCFAALDRSKMLDIRNEFTMSAKKILMLGGDYVEDYEVMVPFQALLMVGPTGAFSPLDAG